MKQYKNLGFKTFLKMFPNDKACMDYFFEKRYQNGLVCPHCGETVHIGRRNDQPKVCFCNKCNNSFSMFTNTIFENSSTSLQTWFYAVHLVQNAKKGISACQIQRETEVTYKTAWRMLRQIRTAMGNINNECLLSGEIEVDETYVGGKPRKINQYPDDKKQEKYLEWVEKENERREEKDLKLIGGNGKRGKGADKFGIFGLYQRKSDKVIAELMLPDELGQTTTSKQLLEKINKYVQEGSTIISDDLLSYRVLDTIGTDKEGNPIYKPENVKHLNHITVCHGKGTFSEGKGLNTNTIEWFWSMVKRSIFGSFHHISMKYAQLYVDEICFRQNYRQKQDDIFDSLISQTIEAKPRWLNSKPFTHRNRGKTYISRLVKQALEISNDAS